MQNRRNLILVVLICLSLVICGCAELNYPPPVKSSMGPNLQKGYLYGYFHLERDFMNRVRLALQLENKADGKVLSIRLHDDQPIYAVEVDPGPIN